jgi:hypothetical protein
LQDITRADGTGDIYYEELTTASIPLENILTREHSNISSNLYNLLLL